ncbi:hypothetical protein RN001_001036 [Aquatica leii]|uniref:EGF-like domain-containing protein n=1 Tax=Aquatica leii TaxID=1421715 RepID=A0AAN7QA34_9COLE|nr:hypothetical protein RN001_001036 [Aquatica leii]
MTVIMCLFIGFLTMGQFVIITGVEDVYSNSYVSPKSGGNNVLPEISGSLVDVTSGPSEILTSESKTITFSSETRIQQTNNPRIERSADPIISKPSGIDELSLKNVADNLDTNDVEFSGRIASFIQPSKTLKEYKQLYLQQTSFNDYSLSGEAERAPQGKSLLLLEPMEINPTATITPNFATQLPPQVAARQANPDIQDIITGIVKLLNGNVNVHANTSPAMGRPPRPVSTRINNRGPPRISDVPILPPDFDTGSSQVPLPPLGPVPPPVLPAKVPTPYPFDLPPQNTSPVKPHMPLLDQMHRPGLHKPMTIPSWNRPNGITNGSRRPVNSYRRPKPPFKPIPIFTTPSEAFSSTEKNLEQDLLTLELEPGLEINSTSDNYFKFNDSINSNIDITTEDKELLIETTTVKQMNDAEELEHYEKNKEKTTSKKEKHTLKVPATETTQNYSLHIITNTNEISPTNTINSSLVSLSVTSTEINFNILTNNNTDHLFTSSVVESTSSMPIIESSIQEVMQTLKEELLSTTTLSSEIQKLSTIMTSATGHIEKVNITTVSSSVSTKENSTSNVFSYYPYRPRPGIVLDDTEYKPGGVHRQPIITAKPQLGDIFDITVSAIQGPGGSSNSQGKPYVVPVDIEGTPTRDVITSPVGNDGFVSIDGKRTYLNLFGDSTVSSTSDKTSSIKPTLTNTGIVGTGYAVPQLDPLKQPGDSHSTSHTKPTIRRPVYGKRPTQSSVRIDTCIVGDDSTCDSLHNEVCRTELGVSSCQCSPGYARRRFRDPCRKIVSIVLSLRVDRLYERRVIWASELANKGSESYQQLSYETERAMESAMSMTPFSDEFLGVKINNIYKGDASVGQPGVFVNITLQLESNGDTSRPTVRNDIQKHLVGVIERRSNNIGNSALWVDNTPGSISNLQDLDECSSPELHDCHTLAKCINVFGGFKCECGTGLKDPWEDHKYQAGRHCEQCSNQHCNNRGECKYQNGQEVCVCSGNYYGSQCEIDGEILGVAIGASVAAVIIIGLTLACLIMWSRRWSRDQKTGVSSPVFGYMATAGSTIKAPVVGGPPYQVSMEDRIRWAQIADVMAQANHYGPEPVPQPARPSSAIFGYPNLSMVGTLQRGTYHGTLPPVPLPRLGLQAQLAARAASIQGMRPLDNSSSSEEEDKADLLGRNFHVPRPKSRSNASIANQSGIYYDVDYEQNDIYKQGSGIPMSTYTIDPLLNQPNKICVVTIGNERLEGVCTTNVQCALNRGQYARNSTCGLLSTCCVSTGSCGDTTSAKISYFKHNNAAPIAGLCTNTIRLINRNICQLRLDIESLNLANPNDQGMCLDEKFLTSTANTPIICGRNTKQHLYLHLNNFNSRQVDLSILNRVATNTWTIKITQLHCPGTNVFNLRNQLPSISRDYALLAPEGCSQYYTEPTGTFRSFGFNTGSMYSRPLRYTICFKRTIPTSQCVRFNPTTVQFDPTDFIYVPGLTPDTVPSGQVSTNEPFIFAGKMLLRFDVLANTPGPFYIYFQATSNNNPAMGGFDITYDTTGASCTV